MCRHRAGDPHLPARRDHHPLLAPGGRPRPPHGVGDPGRRGLRARGRPRGVPRAARRPGRLAAEADPPERRRIRPGWRRRGRRAPRRDRRRRPGHRRAARDDRRAQPVDAQEPGLRQLRRARRGGPRTDSFTLLGGEPATKDIMDGVDTTWGRVPGGAEVAKLADEAIAKFDAKDPAASVPGLLAIRERLAALPADPLVAEKRRQLDRAIQGCLGLVVETTVPQAEVVPGEVLHLRHSATVAAGVPVRWLSVSYPLTGRSVDQPIELTAGAARHPRRGADAAGRHPARPALLAPRGAHRRPLPGRCPALIGRPENPPAFPVEHRFEVGGQTLEIADEPVQAARAGPAGPAARRDRAGGPAAPLGRAALRPGGRASGGRRGHGRARRRGGHARTSGCRTGGRSRPRRSRSGWRRPATVRGCRSPSRPRPDRPRPPSRPRPAWATGPGTPAGRDPARAHPRAVAPAPRAAEGRGPRPRDQGPSRRLPPRRRRQRGRGPRGDGLRGHPARRCGPHAREARAASTPW